MYSYVLGGALMNEFKECTSCEKVKEKRLDFYLQGNSYTSECKACRIKRSSAYAKKAQPWKKKSKDREAYNKYAREYYAKNKERFKKYRDNFKNQFPEYHKEYYRKRFKTKDV